MVLARVLGLAGAAYTPSFADIAIMVEGNASAYLGSPRMAEMVTREKVTLAVLSAALSS